MLQTATKTHVSEATCPDGMGMAMHADAVADGGWAHRAMAGIPTKSAPAPAATAPKDRLASKRLCQLTCNLAHATAHALLADLVLAPLLPFRTPLPRAHGVPLAGHAVEALHPQSTGPPA